jgi:hypothetical protein
VAAPPPSAGPFHGLLTGWANPAGAASDAQAMADPAAHRYIMPLRMPGVYSLGAEPPEIGEFQA